MNLPTNVAGNAARLAREICSAWLDGTPPDARAALDEHPGLAEDSSAVLDLAYAEYSLRREAGERLDPEQFCDAFPEVRAELRLMLCTDQVLANRRSITHDEPSRTLTVWPAPGDEVMECRLLRELGRGAFSRVYLALERSAGDRPVALKLCRTADVEARTLGRLHHDNVVPILWADRDDAWEMDVVCMPFLGSATFADLLARLYPSGDSPPPRNAGAILDALAEAACPDDPEPDLLLSGPSLRGRPFAEGVSQLAASLADALAFLHRRGLYHCDIKPSNLLLTPGGRLLLLDFNLSRAEGVTPRLVGGTFLYMAPEQLRVHADRRGSAPHAARADLFSMGVILYELLTGRLPFGRLPDDLPPADQPTWLLERMPAGVVPLARLCPDVPPALGRVIERCLELDPDRRPASADEVARALRPARRTRTVMAAGVLLVLCGAMLATWASQPAPPRPEPPAIEAERAERTAAIEALARADLSEAAARFRRLTERSPGRWKDQLNLAYALTRLGTPGEAETHFTLAEEAWRAETSRLAAWPLAATGSPLLGLGGAVSEKEATKSLGQILACRAYAFALRAMHVESIQCGQRACDLLGAQDARVLNNLSYCAMVRGDLTRARHLLAQALCLSPDCCPALFNSCRLAYQEVLPQSREVPAYLLDDLESVITLLQQQRLPEPAELYRFAAQVHAKAALDLRRSGTEPIELRRREQRAREFAERGCVLGLDPAAVLRDDFIRPMFGGDGPSAEKLRGMRLQEPVPVVALYLADPLGGPVR